MLHYFELVLIVIHRVADGEFGELEKRPFFLLRAGRGCKRLSCNGWAEPNNVSIQPWYCCLSSKVVEVDEVVLGFLLRGLRQGDSAGSQ